MSASAANVRPKEIEYPPIPANATCWERWRIKLFKSITVNEKHPLTISYFRSDVALLKEKQRHFENCRYIIHPLSLFKQWYDFFCIFFYGVLLFLKPIEGTFLLQCRILRRVSYNMDWFYFLTFFDVVDLLNTALQFNMGYCSELHMGIELDRKKITKRRLTSITILFSVFSSVPRLLYWDAPMNVYLIINLSTFLKLIRFGTWLRVVRIASFIKSNQVIFLVMFFFATTLITHIITCLTFLCPRYRWMITRTRGIKSYLSPEKVNKKSFLTMYFVAFFRSASHMFCIYLDPPIGVPFEEIIMSIMTYILGKLITISVWIILASTFLTTRTLRIKYEEIITELKEYTRIHKVPIDLKKRLVSYYHFKFQKMFFNDKSIQKVLSKPLKSEIQLFLCKSLIHRVSLFSLMDPREVKELVTYLQPVIFLPNDVIMDYRNNQECLYFIASGTIAVHTNSGKEICHLQDGAYFGEISLMIDKNYQHARYTAIEISEVYVLHKKYFNLYFQENKPVYKAMKQWATEKLNAYKKIDSDYKNIRFEIRMRM